MWNWKQVLLATIILISIAFRGGRAIKCYECHYVSGTDIPYAEAWNDKKTNCLNSKIVECEPGITHCRNGTLFYTGSSNFRYDAQYCGSKVEREADRQEKPCEPFKDREATSAIRCRCETDLCNAFPKNESSSTQSSTQQSIACPFASANQSADGGITPVPTVWLRFGLGAGCLAVRLLVLGWLENW
ncbi:uncharacterized protein LOC129597561 [Paramacrobiotus metropolitanus]|uniref:uncharacterized protein LOC129597561 n=1 Tax=Paramacrobiotus metropolitanus TaxID=2943436 RepID=UPI002445932E|nr:uncharacterized protein LOC129597561 [Paramacrobiotus metropolitanus]